VDIARNNRRDAQAAHGLFITAATRVTGSPLGRSEADSAVTQCASE